MCFSNVFSTLLILHFLFKIVSDFEEVSQPAITCLKLTIETLEQSVKYVQS